MPATAAVLPERKAQPQIRRLRTGLGTLIAIAAASHSADAALAAVNAAYRVIARLQALLHPLAAGSDLSRINASLKPAPVPVTAVTWSLLRLARELSTLTDGLFDPCLPTRPGRVQDLELLPDHCVVAHVPVALDFGGFAKGYAIDAAVECLVEHGCSAGVVNAGGDLRAFGPDPCPVLLRRSDGAFDRFDLFGASLAVSDADSLHRPTEHRGYYNRHRPQDRLVRRYAAVLAPTAVLADALAKCLMLCPEATASDLLSAYAASQP
ncbi:MAG TPA: FAD:protein FMN transferase [Steroidobacteraceae bacterium]|nr:FAD:protein FMN transferase [Steroidobacteraceae bacterium]